MGFEDQYRNPRRSLGHQKRMASAAAANPGEAGVRQCKRVKDNGEQEIEHDETRGTDGTLVLGS